jgi:hypothetical protein
VDVHGKHLLTVLEVNQARTANAIVFFMEDIRLYFCGSLAGPDLIRPHGLQKRLGINEAEFKPSTGGKVLDPFRP